jgi:hypothetical protein
MAKMEINIRREKSCKNVINSDDAAEAAAMNRELDYYELRDRFSEHIAKARKGDEMEGLRAFDMFACALDKVLKSQKVGRSDRSGCLDLTSQVFHKVVDEGSDDAVSQAEGMYSKVLSDLLRESGLSCLPSVREAEHER